jgi:hypothetical protein
MKKLISLLLLVAIPSIASSVLFTEGALVKFKTDPTSHMDDQAIFHKCNQVKVWVVRTFSKDKTCDSKQRYLVAPKATSPYDENSPSETCHLQFGACGEYLELAP